MYFFEWQVSKIIDYVELKDGTRQFLVRWKGFSAKDNTWEPEANLNCPELIKKYLVLEQQVSFLFYSIKSKNIVLSAGCLLM